VRGGVVAGILSPPVNGLFRSGHPRALSPTQTRRTTMISHRRRSLFILFDIIADPISSPGSNHSSSPLLINTPPSFRLPLPYSYNPTHSIPSCYYLLDLVSSTQPLMCIISTHAARQCKHVFPPHLCSLLFCVSCTSSIGLPCSAFSISILLMTTMAMTKVFLLLLLRRSFFFLFSLSFYVMLLYCFSSLLSLRPISFSILGMPGAVFIFISGAWLVR
jgi:hypothetical protein